MASPSGGDAWQTLAQRAIVAAALVLCICGAAIKLGLQRGGPPLNTAQQLGARASKTAATLALVKEAKARIHSKWDVDRYPLFLSLVHAPSSSFALQKQKLQALLLSSAARQQFIMGFSGSSVTAGHDNYFHEAFPSVLNATLRPIFKSLDIELVVRNHAFGNNPCCPYNDCLETHLGDDLDILAWEQSMNCGRDPRPVETFLRAAARMPKKPSVWFLTSGTPYWDDCSSGKNKTTLVLIEGKGWVEQQQSQQPQPKPGTTELEKTLLQQQQQETSSSIVPHLDSFTFLQVKTRSGSVLNLASLYGALAPVGQNVQAIEAYRCQPSPSLYDGNFSTKTPGGGNKWHPGKVGHELRADSLSWYLLSVLEAALQQQGPPPPLTPQTPPPVNPIVCNPEECDSRPTCLTDYTPQILPSSLTKSIHDSHNWTLDLSFFDKAAVIRAEAAGRGYLDKKYIYSSNTAHKPLMVRISPRRAPASFVLLCEVQKGFNKYPEGMGDLDKAGAVVLYENVYDAGGRERKPTTPPLHLVLKHHSDQCYRTESIIKPGNHLLALVQRHQDVKINLAYLVFW